MFAFIIRRVLWMFFLLLVISFITFIIFTTLPSADPVLLRAGRARSPELIASLTKSLGLDKPWYEQYWIYLRQLVFHFDFGYSF